MMNSIAKCFLLFSLVSLSGCFCDEICDSGNQMKKFIKQGHVLNIISALNTYSGEAVTTAKYSVFVEESLNNMDLFYEVINSSLIRNKNLDLIAFTVEKLNIKNIFCSKMDKDNGASSFYLDKRLKCMN